MNPYCNLALFNVENAIIICKLVEWNGRQPFLGTLFPKFAIPLANAVYRFQNSLLIQQLCNSHHFTKRRTKYLNSLIQSAIMTDISIALEKKLQ